jgi:lysophospholipase L1-like esterase
VTVRKLGTLVAALAVLASQPALPGRQARADVPPTITIDLAPLTFGDGLTVTGSTTCATPTELDLVATVTQGANRATSASTAASLVRCGPTATAWATIVQASYPAPLEAGAATVEIELDLPGTSIVVGSEAAPVTLRLPEDARFYVAMGDSLATSYLATPGQGYVDGIYRSLRERWPGLVLVNLGCGGTTTQAFVDGDPPAPGACYPTPTSQLDAARTFLSAHRDQVVLTTIDVGGDDLGDCGADVTCIEQALAAVQTNLGTILPAVRSASGGAPLFGMNYYNPDAVLFLDPTQVTLYEASLELAPRFGQVLAATYAGAGVPMADVAAAFSTYDTTPVFDTLLGRELPTSVSVACAWLSVDCREPVVIPNEHANDAGYAVIAEAFLSLIGPVAPLPPAPPAAPPAPVTAPVAFTG